MLNAQNTFLPGSATPPTLVSVILPWREETASLAPALHGYRNQENPGATEVIVLDLAPTPQRAAEVTRVLPEGFPLRYVPVGDHGLAAARNRGVELSQGTVLLFLGDTVSPGPSCLAAHRARHLRDAAARLVVVGEVLRGRPGEASGLPLPVTGLSDVQREALLDWRYVNAQNFSIKRHDLLSCGRGFDADFRACGDDVDLGYRLSQLPVTVVGIAGAEAREVAVPSPVDVTIQQAELAQLFARKHPESRPRLSQLLSPHGPPLDGTRGTFARLHDALREVCRVDSVLLRGAVVGGVSGETFVENLRDDLVRATLHAAYQVGGQAGEAVAAPATPEPELPPDYSIVIVTYNSADKIAACLESIRRCGDGDRYEVVVIDNASADDTVARVRQLAQNDPRIHLLPQARNLGYSGGANRGVQAARAPLVVFLNPDTVVSPHWLPRLAAHLGPDVAAVGPLSDLVAGAQKFGFHYPGVAEATDNFAEDLYQRNAGRGATTKLLIGFCMLVPRAAFEQLGGFDETLFLGNDDLDYSWRARQAGLRLVIATDVFIHHHLHASFLTLPAPERARRIQESTDVLAQKLVEFYGPARVPTPVELWGITWFQPTRQLWANPLGLVSIVILAHNQLHYTRQCIESIRRHTRTPYELILVDNASTDETLAYFRTIPGARIIANSDNLGFARGCNQGMAISNGDYVLLLNNDTIVSEGWIEGMVNVAAGDCAVGIVGPRSSHVSGTQRVGAQYEGVDGLDQFAAAFRQANRGGVTRTNRIVGFCMLIKRAVLTDLGGLDTRYRLGNFEDDDYCVRATFAQYQLAIANEVYIHHFSGRTFAGSGINYTAQIQENWTLFKAKWGIPADLDLESFRTDPGKEVRIHFEGPPQKLHIPLPRAVAFEVVPGGPSQTPGEGYR